MIDLIRREKKQVDFEKINAEKYSHEEQYSDLNEILHKAIEQFAEINLINCPECGGLNGVQKDYIQNLDIKCQKCKEWIKRSEFINLLMGKSKNIVMNSFGNPYIIRDYPDISTYLCAWESQSILQTAAVDAILGNSDIVGKLPIEIPDIAERGSGIILNKSPYYLKPIPKVESPRLQTVMPYEIGVNNPDILKILEQAVADSVFPGGVLLAAKQGKIFIHEEIINRKNNIRKIIPSFGFQDSIQIT